MSKDDETTASIFVIFGLLILLAFIGNNLMECGRSETQFTAYILTKSLLQFVSGTVAFASIGYALANDGNVFVGTRNFGMSDIQEQDLIPWLHQCGSILFGISLVSLGGSQRRLRFLVQFSLGFFVPVILLSLPIHWCRGWLFQGGLRDFSDEIPIFLSGGLSGFFLSCLCGTSTLSISTSTESSPGFGVLGEFCILLGLLAMLSRPRAESLLPIVNGMIGMSSSGLFVALSSRYVASYWSVHKLFSGMVVGLVSICTGANQIFPWMSLLIGTLGGVLYLLSRNLILKIKVKDPFELFSIYVIPSVYSLIVIPLLRYPEGFYWAGTACLEPLGWNILGASLLSIWTLFVSSLFFIPLLHCNALHFRSVDLLPKNKPNPLSDSDSRDIPCIQIQSPSSPSSSSSLKKSKNGLEERFKVCKKIPRRWSLSVFPT